MKNAELIVFVRISLYMLAGRMVAGGWLPAEAVDFIGQDPAFVEAITGLLVGAGALIWYWLSQARAALKK